SSKSGGLGSPFSHAVLNIMFIIVITSPHWSIGAKPTNVYFIEDDPQQIRMDIRCIFEGIFYGADRGTPPLCDADVPIYKSGRHPRVHDRHERRQIDDNVVVVRPKVFKQLCDGSGCQHLTGTRGTSFG